MATIMIYEPNEIIAQKLCDSLKKEKYNAIRCDENVIPSFSDDSIPLVMMGCAAALDHLPPTAGGISEAWLPDSVFNGRPQDERSFARALWRPQRRADRALFSESTACQGAQLPWANARRFAN